MPSPESPAKRMTTFSSFCRVAGLAPFPFAPTRLPSGTVRRSPPSRGQADAPSVDVHQIFDVTASTDYCTFLRQPFTRRAGDVRMTWGRTHSSVRVPAGVVRHNCVFRHFLENGILLNLVTDR